MKRLLAAGFVLFFLGCGTQDISSTTDFFRRGLDVILQPEIKDNLYYLASKELGGRRTGSAGDKLAAKFIAEKFKEYGLQSGSNADYLQKFSSTQNVVGYFVGNDPTLKDEVIAIGGHFDHLGTSGSSYYPGADDNASGTVSVVSLARAISRVKECIRRTVVIMAFSGEEQGMDGSGYYVNNPYFPITNTIYMINLDMVGYLRNGDLSFLGGARSPQVAAAIRSIVSKYPGITSDITSSSGGGSDHVPFEQKKVPAVFVHTGTHANYHKVTDTADKINYDGLTSIIKIAFEMYWSIDMNPKKPLLLQSLPEDQPNWHLDHGLEIFSRRD